jgi:hypothetical protein
MVYSILYINGSGLNVSQIKSEKIQVKGFLKTLSVNVLDHGESKIDIHDNTQVSLTVHGLVLNTKYVSNDLVILEGNIDYIELRNSDNTESTHYYYTYDNLQEPDLDGEC